MYRQIIADINADMPAIDRVLDAKTRRLNRNVKFKNIQKIEMFTLRDTDRTYTMYYRQIRTGNDPFQPQALTVAMAFRLIRTQQGPQVWYINQTGDCHIQFTMHALERIAQRNTTVADYHQADSEGIFSELAELLILPATKQFGGRVNPIEQHLTYYIPGGAFLGLYDERDQFFIARTYVNVEQFTPHQLKNYLTTPLGQVWASMQK